MGNQLKSRLGKMFLALIDLMILFFSFYSAFQLVFSGEVPFRNWQAFIVVAPWLGIASLVIFYFFDLYSRANRNDYLNYVYSILISIGFLVFVLLSLSFWVRGFAMPRSVIVVATILEATLMLLIRTIIWYVQLSVFGKKKVLIIGNQEEAENMINKFFEHTKGWFEISNIVNVNKFELSPDHYLKDAEVILLMPAITKDKRASILSYASFFKKEVLIVPDLYELFLIGAEAQQVDDILVFSVLPPKLGSGELLVKRLFDIIVALVSILILLPIILILMALIPLTSKGPAIYKQIRVGRDEKKFYIYKFRSMFVDAEEKTGPVMATVDDSRITKMGSFLRKTRLDEIPQLFNVLKGDMSIVGPRPERPHFINRFVQENPDYAYRMVVKPGITGLAQIMAKYDSSAIDKLRYDLMYLRNYNILLDLKILFKTLIVVLRYKKYSFSKGSQIKKFANSEDA